MSAYRAISNVVTAIACALIVLPAVLIATGILPLRIFVVHTGSMSPTIPPDSAVVVQSGVYRIGQVITFNTPAGVVTHRLVERRSDGTLVTKGDANATVDPGTIPPAAVIGGVIAAPRHVGFVLTYLRNPLGIASVVVCAIMVWLAGSAAADATDRKRHLPTASR